MNKYEFDKKMHNWQKRSNEMHMARLNTPQWLNEHVCYPVVAGVGTGKTNDTINKIYNCIDFIEKTFSDKTTFSMYVAPTIMLCNQATKEIREYFKDTALEDKIEIKVWHCESTDFSIKDKIEHQINGKHVIWIICSESLLGNDGKNKSSRYVAFSRAFEKEKQKNNRIFLMAAFDEAHNYANNQSEIFGKEYRKGNIIKNKPPKNGKATLKSIIEIFNIVQVASGSPHEYMKELSKPCNEYSKYFVECSFYEAIKDGLIMKPTLYILKGSSEKHWPCAINAAEEFVKDYIKNNKLNTIPKGIMNFNGIQAIHSVVDELEKMNLNINRNRIIIHGGRKDTDKNGIEKELCAEVNGKKFDDTKLVKKMILGIDTNEYEITIKEKKKLFENKHFAIRVFQVDMISEGINIKSLNYCIIETKSSKKCIQQIGRVIRKYTGKEFAFVFVFVENEIDVARLLNNLGEYGLTADCFNWGEMCDLNKSTRSENNDNYADEQKFNWEQIDNLTIENIKTKLDKKYRTHISEKIINIFMHNKYKKIYSNFEKIINNLPNDKYTSLSKILRGEKVKKPSGNQSGNKKGNNKNTNKTNNILKKNNLDPIDFINGIFSGIKYNNIEKDLWTESNKNKKYIIAALMHNNELADVFMKIAPNEILDIITENI